MSTYPRRPKAEAFGNEVDVVECLHDPTDESTERTAPPCSAHVQHNDIPPALDLVEDEGEFRQHDGVATVMIKLPAVTAQIFNLDVIHRSSHACHILFAFCL